MYGPTSDRRIFQDALFTHFEKLSKVSSEKPRLSNTLDLAQSGLQLVSFPSIF